MVIGVDWSLTPTLFKLKPLIVHLYVKKSSGQRTLLLPIVNFSCAELGESKLPVAVALFCNLLSLILAASPVATVTIASKPVVVFFCRSMKNTDLICEGLEIVHCKTKSFSP